MRRELERKDRLYRISERREQVRQRALVVEFSRAEVKFSQQRIEDLEIEDIAPCPLSSREQLLSFSFLKEQYRKAIEEERSKLVKIRNKLSSVKKRKEKISEVRKNNLLSYKKMLRSLEYRLYEEVLDA